MESSISPRRRHVRPQLRMSLGNVLIGASIKGCVENCCHHRRGAFPSNFGIFNKKVKFNIDANCPKCKTIEKFKEIKGLSKMLDLKKSILFLCTYFPFLPPGLDPSRAIYVCAVIYQISKYIMQSITNTSCSSKI